MAKKWKRDGQRKLSANEFEWLLGLSQEEAEAALLNLQIYGVLK